MKESKDKAVKPQRVESHKDEYVYASFNQASRFTLKFSVPVLLVFGGSYWLIWNSNPLAEMDLSKSISLLIYILPGIVVHELLHALAFTLFAKSGFRAISFGIKWEYMSPYCHCNEAVKVWQYAIGAVLPLVVLGLLPAVSGVLRADAFLLFYGIFFIWAAGGDILSLWLLRKYRPGSIVCDHPNEIGFVVYSDRGQENT